MTPDQLTLANVDAPPASLEEALTELKQICELVESQPKLDQLPLLVKRTVFLKNHLDTGILAIEQEVQTISSQNAKS